MEIKTMHNIVHTRPFCRIGQSNQILKRRWVERNRGSWVVNDQILQWRQNGIHVLWLVSKFQHWARKYEIERNRNLINHDWEVLFTSLNQIAFIEYLTDETVFMFPSLVTGYVYVKGNILHFRTVLIYNLQGYNYAYD